MSRSPILRAASAREKNGMAFDVDFQASVAALHLTQKGLRGTVPGGPRTAPAFCGRDMRDFAFLLKRLAFAGAALALPALAQPAFAANPFELNFGLFGPSYDGRVKVCEKALGMITTQFQEKERMYWNSRLKITAYGDIHEIAFRPWQSDNIPRRYCTGSVMLSDGKVHAINYSIIEDGDFAGFGQGVEWCVVGLDRNWAYNPACKAAAP